jgi:SAM-dependent methyltransferase
MTGPLNQSSLYESPANHELLKLIGNFNYASVLDVGAGSGSNLKTIRKIAPNAVTWAITCSESEAIALSEVTLNIIKADLNTFSQSGGSGHVIPGDMQFDLIICSHVLEHLIDPVVVLGHLCERLSDKGRLIIAVPNICHWRSRLKIMYGYFDYEESGVMDKTHLRFFTYHSAVRLAESESRTQLITKQAVGGAILGPLRSFLPPSIIMRLDKLAVRIMPNLFGFETHVVLKRIHQ